MPKIEVHVAYVEDGSMGTFHVALSKEGLDKKLADRLRGQWPDEVDEDMTDAVPAEPPEDPAAFLKALAGLKDYDYLPPNLWWERHVETLEAE